METFEVFDRDVHKALPVGPAVRGRRLYSVYLRTGVDTVALLPDHFGSDFPWTTMGQKARV